MSDADSKDTGGCEMTGGGCAEGVIFALRPAGFEALLGFAADISAASFLAKSPCFCFSFFDTS